MRITRIILSFVAAAMVVSCAGTIDPDAQGGGKDESGNGQGGDKPSVELSSGYLQQMVAMQFTSVGCVNCPTLGNAIKNIQKNIPGAIIPVSFHLDYDIDDPMSLPLCTNFYKKVDHINDGACRLPMFAMNFRLGSERIISEYVKIESQLAYQTEKYPAVCGIAINTTNDSTAGKITVKARFKSDIAASFKYHLFLVEDGIQYSQKGIESGEYTHDNVFRYMIGEDVRGVDLNLRKALVPGQEYEVNKTIEVSTEWKVENLRVVVAMLNEVDSEWGANNATTCAVGSSVDYLYDNKDE